MQVNRILAVAVLLSGCASAPSYYNYDVPKAERARCEMAALIAPPPAAKSQKTCSAEGNQTVCR